MKPFARRLCSSVVWLFVFCVAAFAQDEAVRTVDLPNPMSAHTWFIIAAMGAFLLWCISYAIQLQKEALTKKKGRDTLLEQRETLLDSIAELEDRRETNEVPDPQYRRELKKLRQSLAKVLENIGELDSQRPAKKSS